MKIAIDARIINSGTGRYVERLLHYLEELDHENHYLILVRRADLDLYKPTNSNFTIVEANFADYSFGEQLGLARLLYKLKPDVVHFCMPQQPLLYLRPSVTSILDLNLLRITSNDDMNPLELRVKQTIFKILLWIVAKRSKHLLTISNYSKEDILQFSHVPSTKITVTYPAVDTTQGTPIPVTQLIGVPFIMYVGRAEPYKNNRNLIRAHQQLLRTHPDVRLVIVGRKDILREADIRWAKEQGFKNIVFLGFVKDEQLAWLYSQCRAYVFPSLMEGFGLPSLEAMAYGAPVASSNATCLPEVNGDAAVYFDPTSVDDMVHVIGELIDDNDQRAELILRGAEQIKKYSWQRMAQQTLTIYRQAEKSRRTD